MDDLDFLKWIYERLVEIHREPISVDYMIRFRKILQQMDVARQETREVMDGNLNSIIPLVKEIQRNRHGQKVLTMNEAIDIIKRVKYEQR